VGGRALLPHRGTEDSLFLFVQRRPPKRDDVLRGTLVDKAGKTSAFEELGASVKAIYFAANWV